MCQVTEAECRAALDGERANVSLVRQCVGELGGIPSMLTPFDSTNSPEEKVRDCVTVASISPHEERLPRIKLPQVMSAYLQVMLEDKNACTDSSSRSHGALLQALSVCKVHMNVCVLC